MTGIGGLLVVGATGIGTSSAEVHSRLVSLDTAQPSHESSDSGPACPSLRFFGVRGSGEHSGYGQTIGSLEQDLARKVRGMSPTAINYTALDVPLPTEQEIALARAGATGELAAAAEYGHTLAAYRNAYQNSVTTGLAELLAQYNAYERKCPGHPVMFAGYSQGADVTTDAYDLLPQAKKNHVILVNFGDPHFDAGERWVDHGSYNSDLQAILVHWWGNPAHSFTQSDSGRVGTWCAAGDPVCNWSWSNILTGVLVHLYTYASKYTAPAASWAYQAWRNLPG